MLSVMLQRVRTTITRRVAPGPALALVSLPAFCFATALGLAETGSANAAEPAKAGEALYQAHCTACHGETLEGEKEWQTPKDDGTLPAPPHDDSGHTWHHPDNILFDYTKLGGKEAMRRLGVAIDLSGMPGFGGVLSDEEIWSVLDYIKSTWSGRNRDYQRDRSRKN
jgi:mono/diheme cytochrome c family protein